MVITIRIGRKDIVLYAWAACLQELTTVSKNNLCKAAIRQELHKKNSLCIGAIHQSRIDRLKLARPDKPIVFNLYLSDNDDSEITSWIETLKSSNATSATGVLKSCILRHIRVIPDDQTEYAPDDMELLSEENTPVTHSAATVSVVPAFNGAHGSISQDFVSAEKPMPEAKAQPATPADMTSVAQDSQNNEEKEQEKADRVVEEAPKRKPGKSQFSALGGATRRS